jgi:superfamily II DNA or RNA helicase
MRAFIKDGTVSFKGPETFDLKDDLKLLGSNWNKPNRSWDTTAERWDRKGRRDYFWLEDWLSEADFKALDGFFKEASMDLGPKKKRIKWNFEIREEPGCLYSGSPAMYVMSTDYSPEFKDAMNSIKARWYPAEKVWRYNAELHNFLASALEPFPELRDELFNFCGKQREEEYEREMAAQRDRIAALKEGSVRQRERIRELKSAKQGVESDPLASAEPAKTLKIIKPAEPEFLPREKPEVPVKFSIDRQNNAVLASFGSGVTRRGSPMHSALRESFIIWNSDIYKWEFRKSRLNNIKAGFSDFPDFKKILLEFMGELPDIPIKIKRGPNYSAVSLLRTLPDGREVEDKDLYFLLRGIETVTMPDGSPVHLQVNCPAENYALLNPGKRNFYSIWDKREGTVGPRRRIGPNNWEKVDGSFWNGKLSLFRHVGDDFLLPTRMLPAVLYYLRQNGFSGEVGDIPVEPLLEPEDRIDIEYLGELRDGDGEVVFQKEGLELMEEQIILYGASVLQFKTGSGKTHILLVRLVRAVKEGKRVLIIVNSLFQLQQFVSQIKKWVLINGRVPLSGIDFEILIQTSQAKVEEREELIEDIWGRFDVTPESVRDFEGEEVRGKIDKFSDALVKRFERGKTTLKDKLSIIKKFYAYGIMEADIGELGGGRNTLNGILDISTYQSGTKLFGADQFKPEVEVKDGGGREESEENSPDSEIGSRLPWNAIYFDEGDITGGTSTGAVIAGRSRADELVFFSATIKRSDGMEASIAALIDGPSNVIEGPSIQWLVDRGYLSPVKIANIYIPEVLNGKFRAGGPRNPGLMKLAFLAVGMPKPCLGICTSIDATHEFEACLVEALMIVRGLSREDAKKLVCRLDGNSPAVPRKTGSKQDRFGAVRKLILGEIEFIIATKIFSRGTDMGSFRLPEDVNFFELRSAVLVEGTGSIPDFLQSVGRLTRPEEDEEGNLITKYLLAVRSDGIGRKGTKSAGKQRPKPAGFRMLQIEKMYKDDYKRTSLLEACELPTPAVLYDPETGEIINTGNGGKEEIPVMLINFILKEILKDEFKIGELMREEFLTTGEKREAGIKAREKNLDVLAAWRVASNNESVREASLKLLRRH